MAELLNGILWLETALFALLCLECDFPPEPISDALFVYSNNLCRIGSLTASLSLPCYYHYLSSARLSAVICHHGGGWILSEANSAVRAAPQLSVKFQCVIINKCHVLCTTWLKIISHFTNQQKIKLQWRLVFVILVKMRRWSESQNMS